MNSKQEFSILDPKGMRTIAFIIEMDVIEEKETYTLKMIESKSENEDGKTKKTFYVEDSEARTILMLTMGNNKVIMNTGILQDNEIEITKKPDIVKYEPIISKVDYDVYREFKYTPNLGRPISIIDSETAEEIIPSLYIDSNTGEIVGKCKLVPYKPYIAVEIIDK